MLQFDKKLKTCKTLSLSAWSLWNKSKTAEATYAQLGVCPRKIKSANQEHEAAALAVGL